MNVAISGGLGFIGSRIAYLYAHEGHDVTILDNVHPQIHRDDRAARIASEYARVIYGDVRDSGAWDHALERCDAVFHMAAETGTGQSMDEIVRYTDVNVTGTAQLAQALKRHPSVRKVFLPSSRAVYGEGAYRCRIHGEVLPRRRGRADMEAGRFDLQCPVCSQAAIAVPTTEDTEPRPASIYASTKLAQEQILQLACDAGNVDLRIARYQNVYGPGQAMGNPYTGVLVIFAQQIAQGIELNVYEDGRITRDFVYIDDVVAATRAIVEAPNNPGLVNVGSGQPATILDVIGAFECALSKKVPYRITGDFRFGDIRCAVADVTKLRALGFSARTHLETGISALTAWTGVQS